MPHRLPKLPLLSTIRFLFVGFLLLIVFPIQAQTMIGIGNVNPKAALHVVSPNSGIMIPTYPTLYTAATQSLTALNANDHIGMMIFVKEPVNQGFWFYNGTGFETVGSRVSRTRSIVLDMGSIDVSTAQNINPPVKSIIGGLTPVIGFIEEGNKTLITQIPIPVDCNRTSPLKLTLYYSSANTSGNFSFLIGGRFLSVNTDITPGPPGNNFLYPASSTANGLMKQTISLSFLNGFDANTEVLHLFIQRNVGAIDSATGYFNLLGMRIDYQD